MANVPGTPSSGLSVSEHIRKQAEAAAGPWLLCFDRDGTLAPISADPFNAPVDGSLVAPLKELASLPLVHIAVVSARGIPQLERDFGTGWAVLAGNYGVEISFPDGSTLIQPPAGSARQDLSDAFALIQDRLPEGSRTFLEHHGYSLCLHHHLTPSSMMSDIASLIDLIRQRFPDLWVRKTPTSYEVLPPLAWNKADSLAAIDERLSLSGRTDAYYFYVGDSDLDEPAFQWVNSRFGSSIRVGTAGATSAGMTIQGQAQLEEIVLCLLRSAQARAAARRKNVRISSTQSRNGSE